MRRNRLGRLPGGMVYGPHQRPEPMSAGQRSKIFTRERMGSKIGWKGNLQGRPAKVSAKRVRPVRRRVRERLDFRLRGAANNQHDEQCEEKLYDQGSHDDAPWRLRKPESCASTGNPQDRMHHPESIFTGIFLGRIQDMVRAVCSEVKVS